MRTVIVGLLLAAVCHTATLADSLKEGEIETTFRGSYTDVDIGSDSTESLQLRASFGWMLSDNHEFGWFATILDQETTISGSTTEVTGTSAGLLYHYNFTTGGDAAPYFGFSFGILGGDLGDLYDYSYAFEGGVKFYPFKHGGMIFGVSIGSLNSDQAGVPDADSVSIGAGMLLKFGK